MMVSSSLWTWERVESPWWILRRDRRAVADLAVSPRWAERLAPIPGLRWIAARIGRRNTGLLLAAPGEAVAWFSADRSAAAGLAGVQLPPLVDGKTRLTFPRLPCLASRHERRLIA